VGTRLACEVNPSSPANAGQARDGSPKASPEKNGDEECLSKERER